MKKFTQHVYEQQNELKIIELSYSDFINLCNMYKDIDYRDKYNNSICDIIKIVKEKPKEFSSKTNKYHFLAALKNNIIIGIFYKQLIGNPEIYDSGYIISKGAGKELMTKMKNLGSYTTFSNLDNINSMKMQLSVGGEIKYICDHAPNKENGTYDKELSENIKKLLIDKKLYYKDTEDFYFLDDNGNLKIKELKDFLLKHDKITIIDKYKICDTIKIYFLFTKN